MSPYLFGVPTKSEKQLPTFSIYTHTTSSKNKVWTSWSD